MRALVQRVRSASVEVDGRVVAAIDRGQLVLLGVGRGDDESAADRLATKIVGLRIFPDDALAMNRALGEIGGAILLVSQFTLYADCRRGRRPSFELAESPQRAEELCRYFATTLARLGAPPSEGVFGAHMVVRLENDGPVTIWLDSDELAGRGPRARDGQPPRKH